MRAVSLLAVIGACTSPDIDRTPGEITVVVSSPSPGEEMLAAEHPTIAVTGTVTTTKPEIGALEVWVNGSRIAVASDGTFATELAPELGINHVKVEGGDGIGELVGQELDVLWAPDYLPPLAGTTWFDVASGLELRLGQRFFDARMLGTTLDLSTNPVVATDLASSLELILWHIDLASLLGGGIQMGNGSASINITIPSANPASILVDAAVVHLPNNAIQLDIDLLGVFLEMDGTFALGATTLVIDGGLTADMHASARLAIGRASDGTVQVTVSNVTATVGPLVPAFTGPDGDELDAFITIGNNDFRQLIEDVISAELIPTFTDRIPPLLETLLGATDKLLDNVTFTLDTGLGTPVTLNLDGTIGSIDAMAGPAVGSLPGHVTVRQDLTIRTTEPPQHAGSRGAPRLDVMSPQPTAQISGVHLTMKQDFLNALLHSLWNAGLLDGTAQLGGITATVSTKLPPVVRPTPVDSACTIDGYRCDVIVQLGQLEVGLADFEQSFGISATAGARVVVTGNTVSLVIQQVPTLRVWETSAVAGTLSPDAIHDLVERVVWPEVFGAIGNNLSIELPIPSLAELGIDTLAPGLANAQLQLQMRTRPTVTDAFLRLGADLALETPQP